MAMRALGQVAGAGGNLRPHAVANGSFSGLTAGTAPNQRLRVAQNDPHGMLQSQRMPGLTPMGAGGAGMPEYLRRGLGFGRAQGRGQSVGQAVGQGLLNSGAVPASVGPDGASVRAAAKVVDGKKAVAGGGKVSDGKRGSTPAGTPSADPSKTPKTVSEMSPSDLANRMAHKDYQHQRYTWGLLKQIMGSLGRDAASGYSPDMQASLIAPGLQSQDQAYKNAAAALEQNLASRGLGDSSAMVGGTATLLGNRAAAGSNLVSQLQQRNQERTDGLRQQQAQLAAALHSGSQQGMLAAIQGYRDYMLKQKQMDQMGGFDLGSLLQGMGGLAGNILSAGSGSVAGKLFGL